MVTSAFRNNSYPFTSWGRIYSYPLRNLPESNLFPLHNKKIASLSLDTPSGCMGECPWYAMKASRTGELEYRGIANVEVLGEQNGSVNYFEFDLIASVVETSGFLDLSEKDDGHCISTMGNTTIAVTFLDGRERIFTRDAMNEPPIFWAVAKLIETLLQNAKWGQEEYQKAPLAFAARDSWLQRDEPKRKRRMVD